MTPDSVLEAMAEALAKKYTTDGRPGSKERAKERLDEGMMDHFTAADGHRAMGPVTPREAAVAAMEVVGPILELLWEVKDVAGKLAKSHQEFINEWARHDADAHTLEIQYVMEAVLGRIEVSEPADWGYVARFSATPSEIHDILKKGLHPEVYLAYQRAIAKPVLREAAEEIRDDPLALETASAASWRIDPDGENGPLPIPREVVAPES